MKTLLFSLLFLSMLSFSAMAQKTLTGTISDESGEPLIGATVQAVEAANVGTVTDFDGVFEITLPEGSDQIQVSYVGYNTQIITIGADQTTLDIVMVTDNQVLDELVVVAYGSQTKREITGSVVSVESEEIEQIQTGNVVQGLTGKVSGVQVINESGQPGDGPTIRFRGIGSINASSSPLYVVDGVPYNGYINAIAPQDIESMTFLKDASANALYGSRGANGVIIITTKKGGSEGLEVSLSARYGVNSRAVPDYEVIQDPGRYYEAWYNRIRLGLIHNGTAPAEAAQQAATTLIEGAGGWQLGYNNYNVPSDMVIDPTTGMISSGANLLYQDSWRDELFKNGNRAEAYLSIRSNSDKVNSFLSMGYLDDEGYALQSGFKRLTLRGNFGYNVLENLEIGANVSYANTEQNAPIQNVGSSTYSNLFSWARNVAPIYPVFARDASGNFILDESGERVYDFGEADDGIPGIRPYGAFNNPVATSLFDIDKNIIDNATGRVYATWKFLNGFSFNYNLAAGLFNGSFTTFATPIGGDAKNASGRLTSSTSRGTTIGHQQLLNWTKDIGKFGISAMIGHESSSYNYELLQGQKTNALLDNLPVLNNATNFQYLNGYKQEYNIEGYLSRLNLDYGQKYFVNLSFRRDGSSVFHPDNRWGNFFGIGGAWDVSGESFMSGSFFDGLKLKASYGQQGNDNVLFENSASRNYYAYVNQYQVVNAGGGEPGVSFITLGNPDLVWETSANLNAGIELAMWDDRLSVNVDYFQRKVEDMIFYRPLPLSEGRGAFPENIGDMQNVGYEVSLFIDVVRTGNFLWSIDANTTTYENEITSLPQEFIDDGIFRLTEGRSRYDYYSREFAGVNPDDGESMWYKDIEDGEGNPTGERETTTEYSEASNYFIDKSAIPDFFGGFSTSLSYKGLGLSIGFAYQIGGYGYDGAYQNSLESGSDVGNNYHVDVFDSWNENNRDATIPRIDVLDDQQTSTSDFFLVDATYLGLQDARLSYDLKYSILQNADISRAEIFVAGNNLYLWSQRKGYDPRLSLTGSALNEYSLVRTISGGFNLTF